MSRPLRYIGALLLFVVACSTAQDDKVIEDGGSEPAVALSDGLGGVIDDGDDTQGLTPDPRRGGSDTWTTGPELGPPAGPPESCIVLTPQGADSSDALFAKDCVLDVQVQLAPADWETLRHQSRAFVDIVRGECHAQVYPEVFDWFQADVVVAGQSLANVGIRKKGFFGSLSAEKPSLKIRFNKYSEGQLLAGLDRMTLNNLNQDPSLLNTCLGYQVMSEAGIPAPRCNFARVFVNDRDLGIYAHVDSIKKPYLARHFSSDEGNLYEATLSDFRPEFRGTWEKKTNRSEDDWSDVDAAVEALALPDDTLMEALEAVFDLEAFYTFWAAEVLVAHWDGSAGNLNNHYIYADPIDGRFRFIPWGLDSAFLDPSDFIGQGRDLPQSVYAFGHLAYRLYQHPEGRARYLTRLQELLETVWDAEALVAEIDRIEAMLSDNASLLADQEWALALTVKRDWIRAREGQLMDELLYGDLAWPYEPRGTFCWAEDGQISGTFNTTWGTAGWNYLQQVGTVEHSLSFMGPLGNIAANARERVDLDGTRAVVELIAQDMAGGNVAIYMNGRPELLTPNTSIPIDWHSFEGLIGRFEVLDLDFEFLGAMLDGVLSFEEVSTFAGQRVKGSFSAQVITVP